MTHSPFYALLLRMKYISRWGLMRSSIPENLSEHSLETAVIAHALAVIDNTYLGGAARPEHIACAALFHDAAEILTGDLPTPVKYNNPAIRQAYRSVEDAARESLLAALPQPLQLVYRPLLFCEDLSPADYRYIKAADKICAYLKCVEEHKSGNREFESASQQLQQAIASFRLPAADYFMEHFAPAFSLTLDEQENGTASAIPSKSCKN